MRLWHKDLLPYLPDLQFKGQLRELVAIIRDWRDKGKTNHLLINKVMEYPKDHLMYYWERYRLCYWARFGKNLAEYDIEFADFGNPSKCDQYECFNAWHDRTYLEICMVNLYEKHKYGVGKSRISEKEWKTLLEGYNKITGNNFMQVG